MSGTAPTYNDIYDRLTELPEGKLRQDWAVWLHLSYHQELNLPCPHMPDYTVRRVVFNSLIRRLNDR